MTIHNSGNDTWVDETGVGDGTVFTAARMEKIETAIDGLGGVPQVIAAGKTLAVGANSQVLFRMPITIQSGGQIKVAAGGTLVQV